MRELRPTEKFIASLRMDTRKSIFDPSDKYIWSLAVLADGSVAVGTGDNGKLYRVRSAGAKPEGVAANCH